MPVACTLLPGHDRVSGKRQQMLPDPQNIQSEFSHIGDSIARELLVWRFQNLTNFNLLYLHKCALLSSFGGRYTYFASILALSSGSSKRFQERLTTETYCWMLGFETGSLFGTVYDEHTVILLSRSGVTPCGSNGLQKQGCKIWKCSQAKLQFSVLMIVIYCNITETRIVPALLQKYLTR